MGVVRASATSSQLIQAEREHCLQPMHEVGSKCVLELFFVLVGVLQCVSVKEGLYSIASSASLAFRLGAPMSGGNVVR